MNSIAVGNKIELLYHTYDENDNITSSEWATAEIARLYAKNKKKGYIVCHAALDDGTVEKSLVLHAHDEGKVWRLVEENDEPSALEMKVDRLVRQSNFMLLTTNFVFITCFAYWAAVISSSHTEGMADFTDWAKEKFGVALQTFHEKMMSQFSA